MKWQWSYPLCPPLHSPMLFGTVVGKRAGAFLLSFSTCHAFFPPPSHPHEYLSLLQSLLNSSRALRPAQQLHARLLLSGLLPASTPLATKLVAFYAACGRLPHAHHLFDQIPNKRNLFLWNVLLRGYAWHGPHDAALHLYCRMLREGVAPDNFTFPFVLKACAALSDLRAGREIHDRVRRSPWLGDVFVGAGLIDMYAKCGCVLDAREVFDEMPQRDVVVWNSMIAAYAQNGLPTEALASFRRMVFEGFSPTVASLVTVVAASAAAAALPRGREVHGFSIRWQFDDKDTVKTALLDMYVKSGRVVVARRLFEQLRVGRLVSWNAMINGYAMHGHAKNALKLFDRMKSEGQVSPDEITFVGVLSACSRGGLLEEGRKHFDSLARDFAIEPTLQHYTCLIHLLGHSGRLDEAYDLIGRMPLKPDSGVWGSLLNACKIHRNVKLGELALRKLIELEPDDAGNYVLLANIYAQAGKWDKCAKVRKIMMEKGLRKSIACSWIDIKGVVHAFLVGDVSHPCSDAIYAEVERLEGLMAEAGYVPDIEPVFHDVEEDEKKNMVRVHSERLAVAFGLISTPSGTRLLVTKNLRACDDCHTAIKFISKITQREITIRDVNRYHNFRDGVCSCGDFW